jgi:hypothetical protein
MIKDLLLTEAQSIGALIFCDTLAINMERSLSGSLEVTAPSPDHLAVRCD